MTSETSPHPGAPPPPAAPPPSAAGRGWTGSDLAVGTALIVLLITLFLPWFSEGFSAATVDGPTAHGYLWIVLVLAIVALIVLVARDAIAQLPGNLPSPEQMLVGATGLALILTFLGFVQKPSAGSTSATVSKVFSDTVGVGWSYGGFIAVLVAIAAFIAALTEVRALEKGRTMTMPSLRRRGSL